MEVDNLSESDGSESECIQDNNRESSSEFVASYPGLRGEGKRRPGAHCLRMRVIREAIVT